MPCTVVLVQRVSKIYPLYRSPSDRILELLPFRRSPLHTDFYALRDVSFSAERGEFLGIVGPNGSGKSTLLQILSGILQPTSGRVVTEGRIAALLELGAGFNPEFSGRENVYINGEILGLSRSEIERAFPKIEAFAEIGEFIDRPVKEYSSGMYVRLAFATAIHVDPEILVVDETLAVGDAIFANRCIKKFEEMKDRGVTVLFVSHDLGLVKRLSDRAILMVQGRIEAEGHPRDVVNRYVGLVLERQQTDAPRELRGPVASYRHGDGASRVIEARLLNTERNPVAYARCGERLTVQVSAEFVRPVEDPIVGVLVRNRLGTDVFGTNTRLEKKRLGAFVPGDRLIVEFRFDCLFTQGEYTLTVATQHWDGSSQDWLDDVLNFHVADERAAAGLVNLKTEIEWRKE
ncbi:MAG: ABC transporter ATP-binding protein [Bryobacteraceae bacterium]